MRAGGQEPPGLYWGFDAIYAEEARALCREVVAARGDTWLTSEELSRVLNAFGLPMAPEAMVRSDDEAAAIGVDLRLPGRAEAGVPGGVAQDRRQRASG